MEITVDVREFAKALQRIQGVVEKKSAMPALSHALIRTVGTDRVSVAATDLEVAQTAEYAAEVGTEGAMCLAARPLYDIVRNLPDREKMVLSDMGSGRVSIVCAHTKYRVVSLAADSFPAVNTGEGTELATVPSATLKEMIERTLYAVSSDETRYSLTGVFCESAEDGQGVRMVSTDGHRLSLVERPLEGTLGLSDGVIIPRKGLNELRKLIDEGGDEARIGFVDNHVIFEVGSVRLVTRLIDGTFPNYRQVIPVSSPKHVAIDREAFAKALRRTSLLGSDSKGQGVKLELESGRLQLTVNNPDLGDATELVEVGYEGDPVTIGFNCRYLLEALSVVTEGNMQLELTDDLAPGVITAPDDPGFKAVIMPMRI